MLAVVNLLDRLIDLYIFILMAAVIHSWLLAFNIVNRHNRLVFTIGDVLRRLTEPVLRPIRRYMPDLGGIDLSPIVLVLGLWFIRDLLISILM